ncbi:uncharacterized protein [Antedon mediterranea]|uniref:uncharacterized protein n=1 Tax=Antedon mediterranea TaxID=105859 RepID=UPI003AF749EC
MNLNSYLSPSKTKKPSTLKQPAYEPEAKYIDKQTAISIAKKLRLSKIGNVTLRITNKQISESDVTVSVKDARPTTRRIIMDRNKGRMTAENTKSSAVGKCILVSNDYESRRLSRSYEGIDGQKEQKRKFMMQKKRGFAQRQLAKLQEDECESSKPSEVTKSKIQNVNGKSRTIPHYMSPLKCEKKEPIDPEVAEVTRFIAGNPDPRLQDDVTTLANGVNGYQYKSRKTENGKSHFVRKHVEPKNVVSKESVNRIQHIPVPKIEFSCTDNTDDSINDFSIECNSDTEWDDNYINHNSSLKVSREQNKGNSKTNKKNNISNGIRVDTPKKTEPDAELLNTRSESRTTKTIISQLIALKKTKEKGLTPRPVSRNAILRNRATKEAVSQLNPAKDPRFTNLASSLVPDSAKSHDLYKSMGRLELDNEFVFQIPTIDKSLMFLNDVHVQRHGNSTSRLHTS